MTHNVGDQTHLSGEIDSAIAEKIQPGELEIFLREGVEHLSGPPAEVQTPSLSGVTDKNFALGCSTPEK